FLPFHGKHPRNGMALRQKFILQSESAMRRRVYRSFEIVFLTIKRFTYFCDALSLFLEMKSCDDSIRKLCDKLTSASNPRRN
ncbi:MAG TPA: hypothetical protein VFP18_12150, partial [Candidatus Binatia bacterium]|nr:hypothetical protein [Candidatus Binatia bacterium]